MKLLQQRMGPVNMFLRCVDADWELKVTQDMAYITQCGMDRWRTGWASIFASHRHFLLIHVGSHGALLVEFHFQIP